jgi:hypothetical protein
MLQSKLSSADERTRTLTSAHAHHLEIFKFNARSSSLCTCEQPWLWCGLSLCIQRAGELTSCVIGGSYSVQSRFIPTRRSRIQSRPVFTACGHANKLGLLDQAV